MGQSRSSQFDTGGVPFPVFYTGKTINAVNGSRTAINANVPIGGCVVMDPYQFDGADSTAGAKPVNVTQPATASLKSKKFIVVDVPVGVNDIISGNQRRGGIIWVVDRADDVQALVDGAAGAISVFSTLTAENGSFTLVADGTPTISTGACAQALQATSSDNTLIRVTFGNPIG
jgi:hypothetical protein